MQFLISVIIDKSCFPKTWVLSCSICNKEYSDIWIWAKDWQNEPYNIRIENGENKEFTHKICCVFFTNFFVAYSTLPIWNTILS